MERQADAPVIKCINGAVQVSPVFCDYITFTVDYKKPQERAAIRHRIITLKEAGYPCWPASRKRYKTGLNVVVDNQTLGTMRVHCDPWAANIGFFRAEFNPAKLDLGEAKLLLQMLLGESWAAIVCKARVTRIDPAVDIKNILVDDLLVQYPQMHRSRVFCNSGRMETYELGCPEGERQITVYDKRAKIIADNSKKLIKAEVPPQPLTRCEVMLRPELSFTALAELANPFAKIKVQDCAPLPQVDDELLRLFLRCAQLSGLQDALLILDMPTRQKMRKKLEAAACPWWNPEEIWIGWLPVLDMLTAPPPQAFQAAA